LYNSTTNYTSFTTLQIDLDISNPVSSPYRAVFRPALPYQGTELLGIDPFPPSIALEYERYIERGINRKVLSSRRRAEMRDILQNPNICYNRHTVPDRVERGSSEPQNLDP
jgi:hypothetical protein